MVMVACAELPVGQAAIVVVGVLMMVSERNVAERHVRMVVRRLGLMLDSIHQACGRGQGEDE